MFFYTFLPKLLNMSLTAAVAVVFVLLLRLGLKKAPKWISYALWGVVLFRLLCPISLESAVSLFGLLDAPVQTVGTTTSTMEYIPPEIALGDRPSVFLPGMQEELLESTQMPAADPVKPVVSALPYVWMAGVLGMVAYGLISYLRLRRKLLTASPLGGNIWLADGIGSPFVLGLIQPRIYLPSDMGEGERAYIILHERHHIRRLDHIWKALAFLALCIHWFNPLVWLAFVLAEKDMEMSCDEAVVKKMGAEIRADYAASLLRLATGRRVIVGMPLAFGEGNAKGRIRNLANWKKPAFWAILVAVIACILLAVCLLTNPKPSPFFPMTGHNVSELEPTEITEQIARILKLDEDASALHVNEGVMSAHLTGDFDFAHSDAISFFYTEHQTTYNAQLRIFIEDDQYFVTEPSQWPEQQYVYLLQHYLEALKYLPQEEIRALAPGADQYELNLVMEGAPGNYDRVVTYTKDGAGEMEGWYIHLMVLPMYKAPEGGYSGKGTDVIHVFYGSMGAAEGTALTPGVTYVSGRCVYMNPLSSYFPFGGDSGCTYTVWDEYFETVNRESGAQNLIQVSNWDWQSFPYAQEAWNGLFKPEIGAVMDIHSDYNDLRYLPLTAGKFLMQADGEVWIVELSANDRMGTYVWSIYSLVPESALGMAQWEYAPMLSSRSPVFQFAFDMEHTEISAACVTGQLMEFNFGERERAASLIYPAGEPLSWSPVGKGGVMASSAAIHFSVHDEDKTPYHGTIYITQESSGGKTLYTAKFVGEGLRLRQNADFEGGVISLAGDH